VSVAVGPTSPVDRGRSWLHRLDPLVKLAWLVAVVVVALATSHPLPLFAIALVGFIVGLTAGVAGQIARVLAIFVPISASIIVIQTIAPAACQVACAPAVQLGPVDLYGDGMLRGLSLVGRLVAVETVALAVILTTHPSDLFAALARLRVPYVANLMLSMTLQLIPILQREFEVVLSAQRARGMRSTGFRAVLPTFVPVFAAAFERVQRLTIGLESRGFGAAGARTSYRRVRFGRADLAVIVAGIGAGLLGTIAGLTVWDADRARDLVLPASVVLAVFGLAGTLFVGVILAGIRSLARA
jgi:energy-coupling factor transport system permease protein